jgi:uncharacterized protein YegP (UPF0339 family)
MKKIKMPTWRKNEENKEYTCGSYTIKPDKKGGYSAYKNGEFIAWSLTLASIKQDCYYAMIGVR